MPAFTTPLPLACHKRTTPSRHRLLVIAGLDPAILSIDVGTSATKAALFYPGRRSLGPVYRHPHKTETKYGLITQGKQDWLDGAIATSRQAVCEEAEIVAVSITGQMQDLIAIGEAPPLLSSDVILYSTSIHEHAARLSAITKSALPPTSIPAKLAMLTPGNYRILLGAADFLTYSLSAQKAVVTDATTVSTTSLTASPHRFYDIKLLEKLQQGAFLPLLPEIIRSPSQVGTISEEISSMIHPCLTGVPIIHAGGDAYSVTIGAGKDYIYGGTSGWVGRVFPRTVTPPSRVLTLGHAKNTSEVIAAGSVADVGGCVSHTAKILRCTPEEVGQMAKIGKDGVMYVPYLSGRRCPPGNAYGAWIGLQGDDGGAEMARAVVEGIVYALFDAGKELDASNVVVVGGMVGCDLFVEGIAALFGGCWTGERDVGILGAGLVGSEVMNIHVGDDRRRTWVAVDKTVVEKWENGYETWKSVVTAMEGLWRR